MPGPVLGFEMTAMSPLELTEEGLMGGSRLGW